MSAERRPRHRGSSVSVTPPCLPVVMVAGPQATVRRRLRDLLKMLPVEIEEIDLKAPDEQLWSRRLQEPCPALIVLDIDGDLDRGAQTLRQLKSCGESTRVVVLTREVSRDFGEKIISQGIVYYLTHDFLPDEFLDVIRNLLKR